MDLSKSQWPTVLVLGPTGAGKTSLLQSLFGRAIVSEDRIGHGAPATRGFACYELDGLKIYDSEGLEPAGYESHRARIDGFIKGVGAAPSVRDHVHVAWYAIPGSGARVTDVDLRTIRELPCHVLVLVTKSDITRPGQLAGLTEALRAAGVAEADILPCSVGDQPSLDALLARTAAIFGASHRKVLKAAARRQRLARAEALKVVASSARLAAATGLLPVAAIPLIWKIEQKMVEEIARCFGRPGDGAQYWRRLGRNAADLNWASLAGLVSPWLRLAGAATGYKRVQATGATAIAFFAAGGHLGEADLVAIAVQRVGAGA